MLLAPLLCWTEGPGSPKRCLSGAGHRQTPSSIHWHCRRRTSTAIATSSIAWAAGTALQESLKSIIIVRTGGTTFLASLDAIVVGDLAGHVCFRGPCSINIWIARKDIRNTRGRNHITARFISFMVRGTTRLLCLGGRSETWLGC